MSPRRTSTFELRTLVAAGSRIGGVVAIVLAVPASPAAAPPAPPARQVAPVTIDRILSRPNGEIVTLSDVWQAIHLRLLPPADRTPEAGQRAIENRRLVLAEVNRLPPREPDPAALAARRAAWEREMAAVGLQPAEAVARYGMSPTAHETWLRNDVRIAAYLDQRFAATPEAERPAAIADWLGFLRQRAGLR